MRLALSVAVAVAVLCATAAGLVEDLPPLPLDALLPSYLAEPAQELLQAASSACTVPLILSNISHKQELTV